MAIINIFVRVRPGASRTRVGGSYGDTPCLVVAVSAPPVDGAANESVVRAVAAALSLHPRQVRLKSGATSRTKVLAIEADDSDEPRIRSALDHLLNA